MVSSSRYRRASSPRLHRKTSFQPPCRRRQPRWQMPKQMHDDFQQGRREVEESWQELNLLITKAKAGQVDAAPGFIIAGNGLRPP